jgi:hypothetical protein
MKWDVPKKSCPPPWLKSCNRSCLPHLVTVLTLNRLGGGLLEKKYFGLKKGVFFGEPKFRQLK